ncbi:hypothetical protein AURDEDRAFT_125242 [Auricularia subglabra TFB-10046 SS5]|nr:hypothetical protein AURDEDRAFT_125242 [Auricularia subglabra TFB-10046 SS5]
MKRQCSWSRSSADAASLIHAFSKAFSRSLANIGVGWNSKHDKLSVLPLELRDMCMFSLPISDKLRVAEVCSSWKGIAQSPALWSSLTGREKLGNVLAVLPRSGHLPLDVTLCLSSNEDLILADDALRVQAHRLRTLRLNFETKTNDFIALPTAFGYAAPVLEELQLHWIPPHTYNSNASIIPSPLFNQQAPKLRSLVLAGFGLPSTCHALASVSRASISGPCTTIDDIFDLMPSLQCLELARLRHVVLPTVPRHSRRLLTEVCIRNVRAELSGLQKLGYLGARRIRLFDNLDVGLVADAAAWVDDTRWPESTLSVNGSGTAELVLRADDGRVAQFSATHPLFFSASVRSMLREYNFTDIRHLVLPLDLHPDSIAKSQLPYCPLLRDTLDLPKLQTLTLRFSAQPPDEYSLIDPELRGGVIRAPVLARIFVDRERSQRTSVDTIWAAHLALFITSTLEVDDPRSLLLSIDTAAGSAEELDSYIAGVASEWLAGSVSKDDIRLANAALSAHAHRLRSLCITVKDTSIPSQFTGFTSQFRYAAPLLEDLQLYWDPDGGIVHDTDVSVLPSTLFNEQAPRLRSIRLNGFGLPTACRALASVTSASISGPCLGVENLFRLMPCVRQLELAYAGSLPPVPRSCAALLQEVCIRGANADLKQLSQLGYTAVPRISVSNDRQLILVANAAAGVDTAVWPDSTLSLSCSGVAELLLRGHDGRMARVSARDPYPDPWSIRRMLGEYHFSDIQHLVLPLHLAVRRSQLPDCPLIHGILYLPSLRQLTLRFGAHSPDAYSLLDPHIRRGVINAPLLTCIVVDREHGKFDSSSEIGAARLALLFTSSIEVEEPRSLHLLIDSTSGVVLHDSSGRDAEIEGLRDCVGKLTF